MSRVYALVATIPGRRSSVVRLLGELQHQSRQVDGVVLCLDGYGQSPAPLCPLPVVAEYRTEQLSGPGQRWRVALDLPSDTLLVNLDDDAFTRKAPELVASLVDTAERYGAAAAMGLTLAGRRAVPGKTSRGQLIYAAGCGLALRAGDLVDLLTLRNRVVAAGERDPLGPCGDDDALVSAQLWLRGVPIFHAATGVINAAPGTQADSQTKQRLALREPLDRQKHAIARLTGWPWPRV